MMVEIGRAKSLWQEGACLVQGTEEASGCEGGVVGLSEEVNLIPRVMEGFKCI